MTLTKQVRDWQFDTQLCSKVKEIGHSDVSADIVTDIAVYWLQQAAELASEQAYAKKQATMWNDKAIAEKERADKQQAAIKEALDTWEAMDPFDDPLDTVEKMINLLRPFYPEKEGTQE